MGNEGFTERVSVGYATPGRCDGRMVKGGAAVVSSEPLIDLSSPPLGSETLLRPDAPRPSERISCALVGARKGFFFGILVAILGSYALLILNYSVMTRRIVFVALVLLGLVLGTVIAALYRWIQDKRTFLRVDIDSIVLRNVTITKTIPLEKVFGAAPETIDGQETFRICLLSGAERGFESIVCNFRDFHTVSGFLETQIDTEGKSGNQIAREIIMLNVRERARRMLPVAEMPPFKFSSTWGEGDLLLSSAIRRGASFACDGRILRYRQKLEADVAGGLYSSLAPQPPPVVRENADFRVPVTHVKSVSVLKGPGTVWDSASQIWIHLDPPEGKHDRIQFDLGYFTNGDEIEKYCQCLPTLFPEIGEPESREGDSGFALING